MSGKCKSNQTKTNNLIYIMIFFWGGEGVKKILGGVKINSERFARLIKKNYPPPPPPTEYLFTPRGVHHQVAKKRDQIRNLEQEQVFNYSLKPRLNRKLVVCTLLNINLNITNKSRLICFVSTKNWISRSQAKQTYIYISKYIIY